MKHRLPARLSESSVTARAIMCLIHSFSTWFIEIQVIYLKVVAALNVPASQSGRAEQRWPRRCTPTGPNATPQAAPRDDNASKHTFQGRCADSLVDLIHRAAQRHLPAVTRTRGGKGGATTKRRTAQ